MSESFFRSGGTLPLDSPSYIEREADRELLLALASGEYCFVLNSRQMGKSSLAVRTLESLETRGITTAFVDLTRLGGVNVTPEQWYSGLIIETGRALGLATEARAFLKDQRVLGPAQRFFSFLDEAVLSLVRTPVVVFLDEIDATRSLSFSTDELFAGIRQLHNGRPSNPELRRLTFCLLGVAVPGDLIRDPRMTPFNVGQRIELRDFTVEEAMPLAKALGLNGEAKLRRIMHWTSGHPFLTQSLCEALGERAVDQLVSERYLDKRARDSDSNLADVGNRLMARGDPNVGDSERADTLSLYLNLDKGIPDDESNPGTARIKMSGAARLKNGKLATRNRIYSGVFNKEWVRENMPGQELRRQKKAFWTGVFRTAIAAGLILIVVVSLAISAIVNGNRARESTALANREDAVAKYDDYVSSMQLMPFSLEKNDLDKMSKTLNRLKDNPAKGWEWDYWHRIANRATWSAKLGLSKFSGPISVSDDCRWAAVSDGEIVFIVNMSTGKVEREIPFHSLDFASINWMCKERQILISDNANRLAIYNLNTGEKVREASDPQRGITLNRSFIRTSDPNVAIVMVFFKSRRSELAKLDLTTLHLTNEFRPEGDWEPQKLAMTGQKGSFFCFESSATHPHMRITVYNEATLAAGHSVDIPTSNSAYALALLANHRVAIGEDRQIEMVDLNTGKSISKLQTPDPIQDVNASQDGSKLLVNTVGGLAYLYNSLPISLKQTALFRNADRCAILSDGSGVLTKRTNLEFYRSGTESETPYGVAIPGSPLISDKGIVYILRLPGNPVWRYDIQARIDGLKKVTLPQANYYSDCGSPTLCAVVTNKELTLYDLETGKLFFKSPFLTLDASDVMVSPDHMEVAILGSDGTLVICSVATGAIKAKTSIPKTSLIGYFSPDSKMLLEYSVHGLVNMRSAKDGKPIWTSPKTTFFEAKNAAFCADGSKVAVCDAGKTVTIYDTKTGRINSSFDSSGAVLALAWNHDGTRIFTAAQDRTIRIWDVATSRELGIIDSDTSIPIALRFLPDQNALISVNNDGIVKLWKTGKGR